MKARNVMTVDVTSVDPKTTLKKAHLQMLELGVRHLPVVSRGRLQGIVSDRDLLRAARRKNGRIELPAKPVSEIMSRRVLTGGPKTTVSELAHLMVDEKIDAVPITTPDRELLGLVTSSDLLQLLTDFRRPADVLPFMFNLRHAED
ncbi:MAG: CBS domain-containing protein [Archangiaceae bacterium]|nr:CBS domain-containing protein [Archangiaceae bacterium]